MKADEVAASRAGTPRSDVPDAELLDRFVHRKDALAFEALMHRHGSMLLGLLRRMGLQLADAEDAFQATFMTLVRKVRAIDKRNSLASWLYKVGYRIGLKLRDRTRSRQARHEGLTGNEAGLATDHGRAEFWALLDAEVVKLPEKYRVPFVLCYLQELSIEEAARHVGCNPNTLGTRLTRARARLRTGLSRRGLVVTSAAIATWLAQGPPAQAAVSAAALQATLHLAESVRDGTPAAASAAAVVELSEHATEGLTLATSKTLLGVAALLLLVGATASVLALRRPVQPTPEQKIDWLAQWGQVVDPDRDGRFEATAEVLTIGVPGGHHAFVPEQQRGNAPRVVRKVDGDFLAQVRVDVHPSPNLGVAPVGELFPKAPPIVRGAGLLIRQDASNFVKILSSQSDKRTPAGFVVHWRRETGSRIATQPGIASQFLRVERIGPHLYPASSSDGERWTYLPAVTAEFPPTLELAFLAEDASVEGVEASFSGFRFAHFHYGNNPPPVVKGGTPIPKGCAKCHSGVLPFAGGDRLQTLHATGDAVNIWADVLRIFTPRPAARKQP